MLQTLHYPIGDLLPYVNWVYYFFAWGLAPRFASIADVHACEGCRATWRRRFSDADLPQADEAIRLYDDTLALLRQLPGDTTLPARFGLFTAWSDDDDLLLLTAPDAAPQRLCFLRQQVTQQPGAPHLCLADFLRPQRPTQPVTWPTTAVDHTVGIFVTAVPEMLETLYSDDGYRYMMIQTLCDRLAEAAAEKLHEDIRRRYWGYAPEEHLTPHELFSERYQGRRPAVGYPSLPDQSLIFDLDALIDFRAIGVSLTDSGMMRPHAAVCGLLLGHPACRHFAVGRIDETQLADYAARRQRPVETLRRFLRANLGER